MIKNEIDLKALNSFGICKAYVDNGSVSIRVYGVSGCLKAWLTGKTTLELGNLVNGTISREIDTSAFEGILITQSGRQMFYGEIPHRKDEPRECSVKPDESKEDTFPLDGGYMWREITDREYPSESLTVRYILSHKCFYHAFMMHGRYFYGTKGSKCAVAIECNIKSEPNPLLHLSPYATYHDGFMVVCADTDAKSFFTYE